MSKSNYFEDLVLNVLRAQNITAPANVYVGLASAPVLETHTGATVPELADANGYARQAVTFGAPSGGSISNTGPVNFEASGGDWTTATHFFVADSATHGAGNILVFAQLTDPVTVADGTVRQFAIGGLVVQED